MRFHFYGSKGDEERLLFGQERIQEFLKVGGGVRQSYILIKYQKPIQLKKCRSSRKEARPKMFHMDPPLVCV